MKVYGLYYGCRFEGGNVCDVYATPEKALKAALKLLKHERAQDIKVFGQDSWEETINKWNTNVIKIWRGELDEIIIYEYEVK